MDEAVVAAQGGILPAFVLLAGALGIALAPGRLRDVLVLAAPLGALAAVLAVPDGVALSGTFLSLDVEPLQGSAVRRLFGIIFASMAFAGGLFALRQASTTELSAAMAYAAGALGVTFSGDLLTLFLWWEVMAIASTVVVWCGGRAHSRAAGFRYAIMHIAGGLLLMTGIIGIVAVSGDVDVRVLTGQADTLGIWVWFILAGVLVNTAAPPVSAWLADAYPEASATGSVFLSAFTTKSAVLTLILLFPGESILIWVGLWMVFYGILYALLENDARRILAYSVVNQVGFMVCAVGIGTAVALNGAAAHAFAHIMYKALLFMSAGVVLHRTGFTRCTDLGGLFRTMPITTICGIVGALAISSFPLTSGYTTKTLISVAADESGLVLVYFLLAAASAGVFLHAGIKFPWFVFFQKDSGLRPKDAPWNMAAAMILLAVGCVALGVFHQPFYELLPFAVDYAPYKPAKVLYYLQLLLFSGLAFFVLLPLMRRTETISLDWDWFWRAPGAWLARRSVAVVEGAESGAASVGGALARRSTQWAAALFGPGGRFHRPLPIGGTALWIAVLLTAYVVVNLL
jgi:multicomponent Na+:H+ antiporter subunit D